MNSFSLFRFAAALTAALVLSACSCVECEEKQQDDRVVVTTDADFSSLALLSFEEAEKLNMESGKVYLDPEFARYFELKDISGEIDENGLLLARVTGKTKPYSWWTWLWKGEEEIVLAYRFIWFDKDGKMLKIKYNTAPRIRKCMPGDPVRFSARAREEQCVKFSLAVGVLSKVQDVKDAEAGLQDVGARMEVEEPKKEEPLKEVKISQ